MILSEILRKWFRLDKPPCESCETLKMTLSIANDEKRQLLNMLLSSTKSSQPVSPEIDYEKVKPKMMTWNIRRQMLEAEDRKAAQLLADQKRHSQESVNELEKELGLEEVMK